MKHGLSGTSIYNRWWLMKSRCYNPKDDSYVTHGARGIEVCEDWKDDFIEFHKWAMGNGYKERLTIDRIDNDGNYEPSNFRWVTMKEQVNNRSNTIMLNYKGVTKPLGVWAESIGIKVDTFRSRLNKGWSIDRTIETPLIKAKKIKHNGKTLTVKEWAKYLDINYSTLRSRLSKGWEISRALTK